MNINGEAPGHGLPNKVRGASHFPRTALLWRWKVKVLGIVKPKVMMKDLGREKDPRNKM